MLDDTLRERLVKERDLNLGRALDICKIYEAAKEQVKNISNSKSSNVDSINNNLKKKTPIQKSIETAKMQNAYQVGKNKNSNASKYFCKRYGIGHKKFQCPAFRKMCNNCKKKKHKEKVREVQEGNLENYTIDIE
ncbi:K02A2.6-like [Cordylochernes scorpioides]|uniref:K02A2.6-like n=1 Tax=Cordylochernes scorpioides TaxID=51811 RepID=A0ABY6KGE3_9ARAC|nr:K02A2.6-like [Cordylochernes scorpioides]